MAYICLPFTKLPKLDVITLYCPNLISIFNQDGFASNMKLVLYSKDDCSNIYSNMSTFPICVHRYILRTMSHNNNVFFILAKEAKYV